MHSKVVILLISTVLASTAAAADVQAHPACHQLMTEKECDDHLTQLATLASGEILNRYLTEYTRIRKERETACNCLNLPASWARMPLQRQALLLN